MLGQEDQQRAAPRTIERRETYAAGDLLAEQAMSVSRGKTSGHLIRQKSQKLQLVT
jgi:hypothetical protein